MVGCQGSSAIEFTAGLKLSRREYKRIVCALSDTYKEAASDILNEAANELSVGQFFQKQDLKARFELYQRRALWASLVARQVAADASMADDVPNLDEQIGNVLYEELQNCPPLYDQLTKVYLP